MSDRSFNTVFLQSCLDRMRAGESQAENDLVKVVQVRLRALVARMYRGFPNIRSIVDIDDVFQESVIDLLRTLRQIRPAATRDFMNLAAVHIKRVLIKYARRVKNKRTRSLDSDGSTDAPPQHQPAAPADADMDEWEQLHEAIDQLPIEVREVVHLVFYHGWKQEPIAELLQVSVKTIYRRWTAACQKIRKLAEIEGE